MQSQSPHWFRRDDGYKSPVAPYNPKAALSVIAMIVFIAMSGALWYRYYKEQRPRPKWMKWLSVGTTMMAVGFAIRISRSGGTGAWSFIFETMLLLSAPCAIIAQNYKLLNLLSLYLQADDCLLIRRKWSMPLFLTSDAITFLAQLAGTGMIASTIEDIMEYGRYVTLGGLIVQAVSLATFITSWLTFRRRLLRSATHADKWSSSSTFQLGMGPATDFRWIWKCIGLSCLCCLIRAIYRVVEYGSGTDSYITSHEVFFYLFDTIPLAISAVVYIYFWPPRCIGNPILSSYH